MKTLLDQKWWRGRQESLAVFLTKLKEDNSNYYEYLAIATKIIIIQET